MPAEKDPFEIAKRLDQFGAGKRPPRPEVAMTAAIPLAAKKRKAHSSAKMIALLVLLALAGWLVCKSLNRPLPRPASQAREAAARPVTAPPKSIPALDGNGEVPAFTVQVPGSADSPDSSVQAGH